MQTRQAVSAHRARLWWRAISRMIEPHVRATSIVDEEHLQAGEIEHNGTTRSLRDCAKSSYWSSSSNGA